MAYSHGEALVKELAEYKEVLQVWLPHFERLLYAAGGGGECPPHPPNVARYRRGIATMSPRHVGGLR
eukprot:gene12540-20331_t